MKKKIKLMADYNCSPLWDMEDGLELDIDCLPLSCQTKKRLMKWAETYDQTLNLEDPSISGFKNVSYERAFECEGRKLWQIIKDELMQHYNVSYFSEMESKLIK